MSKRTIQLMLLTSAVALCGGQVLAQTNVADSLKDSERAGRVIVPEKPTAPDANLTTEANAVPDRPERSPIPPALRSKVDQFKIEANRYLREQQELKKQMEGANDEERERIRQRRIQLRQQWLERTRGLREEWKERQAELAGKLKDHREVLDSIRTEARDELRETVQENKDRRGTD